VMGEGYPRTRTEATAFRHASVEGPTLTAPGHRISRPSPVWATLAFTFVNSVATGVTFNGIPFINKSLFHYGLAASSALGVLLGVTYIFGAMFTGPFLRWAERTFPWCTPRTVLLLMMLLSAVLNAVPTVVWFLCPSSDPESRAHATQIGLWLF